MLNSAVVADNDEAADSEIDALGQLSPLSNGSVISDALKGGAALDDAASEIIDIAIECNILKIGAILEGTVANSLDIDLHRYGLKTDDTLESIRRDSNDVAAVIIPGDDDVSVKSGADADYAVGSLKEVAAVGKTLSGADCTADGAGVAREGVSALLADLGGVLTGCGMPMAGAVVHPSGGVGVRQGVFNVTLGFGAEGAGADIVSSFTAGGLFNDLPL